MIPIPSSTSSSEPGPGNARSRWPLAFLASIGLFCLGEHLLWTDETWLRFLAAYSPKGLCDVTRTTARSLLLRESGGRAVVFLGSSQVAQGVDCTIVSQELQEPCLNLGINGGSPLDALFMVGRLGRAQRITVLGLFPRILHTPPKRPYSDPETLRCIWGSFSRLSWEEWRLVLFGQLENLSESLRNKDALNRLGAYLDDHLLDAWRGRWTPTSDYMAEGPLPAYIEHVDIQTFSDAEERAVDFIVEGERSIGNPVVIVDFPVRQGYEHFVTPAALARYRALFERLSQTPGVRVLGRPDLPPLVKADFMDMTHLREGGRQAVSRRLAEILGRIPQPTKAP